MQCFLFIFDETPCGQATTVVTVGSDNDLRLYFVSFWTLCYGFLSEVESSSTLPQSVSSCWLPVMSPDDQTSERTTQLSIAQSVM